MRLLLTITASVLLAAGTGDDKPARDGKSADPFMPVDVFVDSGNKQLVAYQLEITYDHKQVKIISLEGGEPEAFKDAPHYDPAGMTRGRIIIAAFTTDHAGAPKGKNRLARLHLTAEGHGTPKLKVTVVAAAKPGGKRLDAKAELEGMRKTRKGFEE